MPSSTAECVPTATAAHELVTPAGLVYATGPTYCWNGDLTYVCEPWDDCPTPCVDAGGLHRESNGVPGLQRWWDERCGAPVDANVVPFLDEVDLPGGR